VHRRTLLLGLAAGLGGRTVARTGGGGGSGRRGVASILGSTRTSTLAPRSVTAYTPPSGEQPAAGAGVGRVDYAFTRDGRALPTRVWYPAGPGPYPLVVFSHGLHSQPGDYADLLVSWAAAGFVVAAPLYPHTSLGAADFNAYDIANQPADASAVLTRMLASPLRGRLDPGRLAAAGHSAGGITTVGMFSAHRDPRLKAGVVLAGTDFLATPFTGPAAAMLVIQGRKDETVSYRAARTLFEAIPWSRAMLTLADSGHQISAASASPTSIAFLRWALYGGTATLPATPGFDDQLEPRL
jgi:dienelactone hydrolase